MGVESSKERYKLQVRRYGGKFKRRKRTEGSACEDWQRYNAYDDQENSYTSLNFPGVASQKSANLDCTYHKPLPRRYRPNRRSPGGNLGCTETRSVPDFFQYENVEQWLSSPTDRTQDDLPSPRSILKPYSRSSMSGSYSTDGVMDFDAEDSLSFGEDGGINLRSDGDHYSLHGPSSISAESRSLGGRSGSSIWHRTPCGTPVHLDMSGANISGSHISVNFFCGSAEQKNTANGRSRRETLV